MYFLTNTFIALYHTPPKFKMCLFLDEACSLAEKLFTAGINLPFLMPDEDNNFGGSLSAGL